MSDQSIQKQPTIGIRHLDWVQCVLDTELPAPAKHLALILSTYMNRYHNVAWPSLSTLQRQGSLSHATVLKHLDVLEDEGWLIRERGNAGKSTRYHVAFPVELQALFSGKGADLGQELTQGRSGADLGVGRELTTNHQDESPTESPKQARSPCPYTKIVDLYHEILPDLPRVEALTPTRKGYLRTRWQNGLPDIEHWSEFFKCVARSDFLMGRTEPGPNRKPFRANLEWITKPNNYVKILEGNYHE